MDAADESGIGKGLHGVGLLMTIYKVDKAVHREGDRIGR